jgi:hypothetical protein
MKRFFLNLIPMICLFLTVNVASSATYYIRTDGGTSEQCNGTADAPYLGSGTNQPCAWSHPSWAINSEGTAWTINGGDTLIISQGSYMIGYGAPNTSWCDAEGAYGCVLHPIPSGLDPSHPTRILGKGWDSSCSNPPELWGTERLERVLSLQGSSNVVIDCFEITDHLGCAYNHGNHSVRCEYDHSPYGQWAYDGIFASDSSNVTLKNLNIHGLGGSGIHAARLTDWVVENVRLTANGLAGWDGDLWDEGGDSNSGTLRFNKWIVEWNGCVETYPGKQHDHCWAQSAGGYGDGVGVGRSGGHWIIEDSIFRYNTSDGLDLLYVGVDHPDSFVEIRRTIGVGNAGNQLKVGGSATIVNSLAIGNCSVFYQKSFAQEMGDMNSGDQCRAGGATLSINLGQGDSASIVNSTIVSQGWALIEAQCNTTDFPDQPHCNGTELVTLQNNVFMGYQVIYLGYERLTDFIGDGDPGHYTTGRVDYNVIYNAEVSSSTGSHDIFQNPLFVNSNPDNFDGHLQIGGPAIDSGLSVGSLNGLVPSTDLAGAARPYGNGVDRGAYEYGATPPVTEIISPPIILNGPISGITGTSYTYSTGSSLSNMDHSVQYFFDWDDGTNSGWLPVGITSASKTWTSGKILNIKSKARCATDTSIESNWSNALAVTISNVGPDLTGQWTIPLQQTCKNTSRGQKCTIKGTFTINNIGNKDASSTYVEIFLSDDDTYQEGDSSLKRSSTGKIKAGRSKAIKLSKTFPIGQTASGKYIIAVIDGGGSLAEIDETNNIIVFGPIP